MNDKKLSEGHSHMRAAEGCQKTSLFKWKPDLDGAIDEYQKAATCFRTCKAYDLSKNAYIKTAELQAITNSGYHAAKNYEQVALLCKETKHFDQAAELMEKAAQMFCDHGTPDSARLVLEKGAKMTEKEVPLRAVLLYRRASGIADQTDRPNSAAENIGKAARLYIHQRKLDEALECLNKEIQFHDQSQSYPIMGKAITGVILVFLHNDDFAGAYAFYERAFKYPGFPESDDAAYMHRLLKSFDTCDEDAGRAVLDSSFIRHMDNAFSKLARDLVIPTTGTSGMEWGPSPGDPVDDVADAAAMLAGGDLDDDDDDDDDDEMDLM